MFLWIYGIRVLLLGALLFSYPEHTQNVLNAHSTRLVREISEQNISVETFNVQDFFASGTDASSPTVPETEDEICPWNKTTTTAVEYQVSYCTRECHDGVLRQPTRPDMCLYVHCFPCDCNKPLCEFYGTCCRDSNTLLEDSNIVSTNSSNFHSRNSHNFANSKVTEIVTGGIQDNSKHLVCDGDGEVVSLYYRSCPSNYPDVDVISKCQKDIPWTDQDLNSFTRVVDDNTGRGYYNKYCAVCNGVSRFTPLDVSVECEDYMTVYTSRTSAELLRLSLASDSGCKILQKPPDGVTLYPCHRRWFPDTIIDTCNVTGEWDVYDEDVIKSCADLSDAENRLVLRTRIEETVYRNLFCAICNMHGFLQHSRECESSNKFMAADASELDQQLPFSVLLNFGSHRRLVSHEGDITKCSTDSDWTSPDDKCLPLQCSPGKVLVNGSCSTALSEIRGLLYQLQVYYVPTVSKLIPSTEKSMLETNDTSNIYKPYLDLFENRIKEAVFHVAQEFRVMITMVFSNQTLLNSGKQTDQMSNLSSMLQINWFTAEGFIRASSSVSRDYVEEFLVNELIMNNVTINIDESATTTFTSMLQPRRNKKTVTCNTITEEGMPCLQSFLTYIDKGLSNTDSKRALIIDPNLNRPFVQFNQTEYSYENSTATLHRSRIVLYFNDAKMIFSETSEINQISVDENGTLSVCHDLLTTKDVEVNKIIRNILIKMSQYVLTLMFLISSIFCLTATLFTYFLFPVLRSIAGKNNMFLCLSLLMAQLLLLATSHIPETGHLCTVLAVSTHYSWLSMFCWCFTCCFHMFCIFSAKTRNLQATASSERVYMIKRVVLCSILPGLIVTGVITTNYSLSGGQLIGYGSLTCFIDSQIIMIITLVVPLCLIIVLNFIFFSITVIKIYNVRKLQTREFRKDDHNNLYIYMKLSSMTGIFWILSVISEATNNDPLRFIAIGLNGLQGVFIFLSYICNRRVLRLYMKALGLAKPLESSLNRSTIAKVISEMDSEADRTQNTSVTETV